MTTADGIRPTVHEALQRCGLVLEDVVVTPAGRRRVVKVLVDRALVDLAADRVDGVAVIDVAPGGGSTPPTAPTV